MLGTLYMLFLIPTLTLQHGKYYSFYTGEEADLKSSSNLPKVSYPSFLIEDFFFLVVILPL